MLSSANQKLLENFDDLEDMLMVQQNYQQSASQDQDQSNILQSSPQSQLKQSTNDQNQNCSFQNEFIESAQNISQEEENLQHKIISKGLDRQIEGSFFAQSQSDFNRQLATPQRNFAGDGQGVMSSIKKDIQPTLACKSDQQFVTVSESLQKVDDANFKIQYNNLPIQQKKQVMKNSGIITEEAQKEKPGSQKQNFSKVKQSSKTGMNSAQKKEILLDASSINQSQSKLHQSQTSTAMLMKHNQLVNHHPQIIDEDTELFKLKLENLLGVFRNDALKEFMCMKKQILEEQARQIQLGQDKYIAMFNDKSREFEDQRKELCTTMTHLSKEQNKVERLCAMLGCSKINLYHSMLKQKYFLGMKVFMSKQKDSSKIQQLIKKNKTKRILTQIFGILQTHKWNEQMEKQRVMTTKSFTDEIDRLTNKFNKDIQLLSEQLSETKQELKTANAQKESMQENLKKAFMRGVCALNFEAMNIIGTGESQQHQSSQQQSSQQQQSLSHDAQQNQLLLQHNSTLQSNTSDNLMLFATNSLMGKMQHMGSEINGYPSNVNSSTIKQSDMNYQNTNQNQVYDASLMMMQQSNAFSEQQSLKKVTFYAQPSIESKDHKWKEAPIIGVPTEYEQIAQNEDIPQQASSMVQPNPIPDYKPSKQEQPNVHDSTSSKKPILKNNLSVQPSICKENVPMSINVVANASIVNNLGSKGGLNQEGKVIKVNSNGKSFTVNGSDNNKQQSNQSIQKSQIIDTKGSINNNKLKQPSVSSMKKK